MYVHHAMRTLGGQRVLAKRHDADHFWRSLRRAFPDALAAALMPNHFHLVDETDDPARDHELLARVAAAFTRRIGARRVWEPSQMPERVEPDKLARHIRYTHLNPTRAGIVEDPLSHVYCTHRGAIGAEHDPWVPGYRVARAIGFDLDGFAERFHAYVSSDPSVSPRGTIFPARAPSRTSGDVPLGTIIVAAKSATFWCKQSVERHATVLLAMDQGWTTAPVARALGITPDSVRRFARTPHAALLDVAKLCLGDPRLRR